MFFIELSLKGSPIMVNMGKVTAFEPKESGAMLRVHGTVIIVENSYEEIRDRVVKKQGYTSYSCVR